MTRLTTLRDLYRLGVLGAVGALARLPPRQAARCLPLLVRLTAQLQPLTGRRARRAITRHTALGRTAAAVVWRASLRQLWLDLMILAAPAGSGLRPVTRVEGRRHLERALAGGRGAVLGHSAAFGLRHAAQLTLGRAGIGVAQLRGPGHFGGRRSVLAARQLAPVIDRWERRLVEEVIEIGEDGSLAFTRALLGRLAGNGLVHMSIDGAEGQQLVELDFLERRCEFATGVASLARVAGAPILPASCVEVSAGEVVLTIEPPLEVGSGGRQEVVREVLQAFLRRLEEWARRHPDHFHDWDRYAP